MGEILIKKGSVLSGIVRPTNSNRVIEKSKDQFARPHPESW